MLLLKNCYYVATFDEKDTELKNVDILIEGNRISKIGKNFNIESNYTVQAIDCSNLVILPGLVNTHHHFFQVLTRNYPPVQNAKLFDWLVNLYKVWKNIDEEAIYYSSLIVLAELLKTGCTLTSDNHYLYPEGITEIFDIQLEAAKKLGIRTALTRGSMTMGESEGGLPPDSICQDTDTVIKDSLRVIEKFHKKEELAMRRVILGPCSPFNVAESTLTESEKLARSYGVRLHTHLAETLDEERYCLERYGVRPLKYMEKLNWLGEDVFYAHGIWFNDEEMKILAETKTGVSHNPSSNMRLGSGIARVKEMLEMGIPVSLAVDGSSSNDTSDMLGEVRTCMLLQRIKYGHDALSARDALKVATRGGAKMLGFDKLGMIKEGFGADLIGINIKDFQYAGSLSDPLAAIVFTGYNHNVDLNIVNGKITVAKGRVVGIDEEELVEKVNEISLNLIKKANA
ncbi:hydroxyatrazine ethylaminohydrolase [Thermotomaculum hydrothermale]|uniref:Hydroxyatrazine ethylaminohydrolase n=1 Tax=Thermotomaculum hydrothermale TaxID=981385 RepID=A0A7R6SYT0_9BACT|nr:8-oxoguanine deaminase [Thermotomaculum hydrothermale]BBB32896.1 hydroxyatrazine ethylaminohydrolase [Thermotomaculum hydrothermale]